MFKWVNDEDLERRISMTGVVAVAFVNDTEKASRTFLDQFQQVATAFDGVIPCYALSAQDNPTALMEHKVYKQPTTVLYRDGKEIARYEILYGHQMLCERIIAALKKP
ncbi:MAG TPA: hypothetical protein VLJ21_02225 [Candidatus Binatia bacterium]|nr:hypothetical protein [Candidatus Binatia bacterium]